MLGAVITTCSLETFRSVRSSFRVLHRELVSRLYCAGVPLIPVTAEAAGKGVKRRAGAHTAADMMEEALAEQLVARKAASFFKPESEVDKSKPHSSSRCAATCWPTVLESGNETG